MRTLITVIAAVVATVLVMTHLEQVINFLFGMVILGVVFAALGTTRGLGGKIIRSFSRAMWRTLRTSTKLVLH